MNRPVNSAELVYLTRIATLVTAALLLIPDAFSAQPALVLDTTITMPDVRGRIDHLAIDEPGGRLFVAALGNNTVEIIDLKSRQRTGRLESLREPQGVAYVPNTGQLFVANGGGDVSIFAGMPPITSGRITGLDDADNVRLDAPGQHLYVGYGNALAAIDVVTQKVTDRISLAGHPEGFQLDPSGPRIYVNVPSAGEVAVLDRDTHRQIATWRLSDADGNFPMAIDAAHRRLLVGTRRPARLLAYDIDSGNVVATLPIGGDVDDIFLDVKRRRIYAICGEGVVTVIQQAADSDYQHAGDIKTAPGSRTGLLVPDRDALYVAVPTRAASPAEIRVYALQ